MYSLSYLLVVLALCGPVLMSPTAMRSSDDISIQTGEEVDHISIPVAEGDVENQPIPVTDGEVQGDWTAKPDGEIENDLIPTAEGEPENNSMPVTEKEAENNSITVTEREIENSTTPVAEGEIENNSTPLEEGERDNNSDSVTEGAVEPETPELKLAKHCDMERCHLPDCRCASTELNETIAVDDTPQLVMLTFDDAVTAINYEYIEKKINGRRNPDGCPVAATFYVSHEYTDYSRIHKLWAAGHEIALHSITHNFLAEHWRKASVEQLVQEFGEQRQMMANFGQIDIDDIKGMRLPLFEMSGNNSFQAMLEVGLQYDSSWPTQEFIAPGLWPYTLEYKSIQDCPIGICPTASMKNAWVLPITNWVDTEGNVCAMVDACIKLPKDNVEEVLAWMIENFERSYKGNRAPFGVYMHAAWFQRGDSHLEAYGKFLDYLGTLNDVYIVGGSRVIEFAKNPRAGRPFDKCQATHTPTCKPKWCKLIKESTGENRFPTHCATSGPSPCPRVYPWLGNPFGI